MKIKPILFATLTALTICIVGCGSIGKNPSPPNKTEQAIFNIETNLVAVATTNSAGDVSTVIVPKYTLTPSPSTAGNVGAIRDVGNLITPGAGTLVGGILAGILGAWARMRSAKNAAPVLAQNIETLLEFVSTLPDGAKYRAALTDYMKAHQTEAGTADAILRIVNTYVSNPEAKGAVVELQAALGALK